jgi:hypothetical protein
VLAVDLLAAALLVVAVLVVAVLSAAPPQAIKSMPVTRHRAIIRVSLVVIGQFSLLQEMKNEVSKSAHARRKRETAFSYEVKSNDDPARR